MPSSVKKAVTRKTPPATRRSQAERSALTRERVLATAIKLLARDGYTGATTMAIAKESGLSLGALQHQFPTKASLMVAVLREFTLENMKIVRQSIRGVWDPKQRLEAVLRTSWNMMYTQGLVAELEISLAARNDAELEKGINVSMSRQKNFIYRMTESLLTRVANHNVAQMDSLHLLSNAIVRGMALSRLRGVSDERLENARLLWQDMMLARLAGEPVGKRTVQPKVLPQSSASRSLKKTKKTATRR